MSRNTHIFMLLASALLTVGVIGVNALFAYEWSFTDTSFGGYLGVAIPTVMTFAAFALGTVFNEALNRLTTRSKG